MNLCLTHSGIVMSSAIPSSDVRCTAIATASRIVVVSEVGDDLQSIRTREARMSCSDQRSFAVSNVFDVYGLWTQYELFAWSLSMREKRHGSSKEQTGMP